MTDNEYTPEEELESSEDLVYDDAENAVDKIKDLKAKLKQSQEERQEYLDGWQRAKADLINVKKRAVDEQGSFLERAGTAFVEDLFPVLDSFDMAFKNKEAWESAPEQWRRGVEYIHGQLLSIIESRGVKIINPLGQPFNHNEHQSIASITVEDPSQEGIVLDVVRTGYKLGDTVIRPADVKVGSNV